MREEQDRREERKQGDEMWYDAQLSVEFYMKGNQVLKKDLVLI